VSKIEHFPHIDLLRSCLLTFAKLIHGKDVSSVPTDPDGTRHHMVETRNVIDTGTSVLLDAQATITDDASHCFFPPNDSSEK